MKKRKARIINVRTLHIIIGVTAFILPFMLVFGSWILSDCTGIQNSISTYYFTIMRNYYVGSLCALSFSLFVYKGFEKTDDRMGDLAALLILLVAFLPTAQVDIGEMGCYAIPAKQSYLTGFIHKLAAGFFLLTLSYYSIFIFTKSAANPTPQKLIRNKIYKTCGYIMAVAIVLIALFILNPQLNLVAKSLDLVFWLETLALFAFGTSWLTKGNVIFPDKSGS